jgi:hypothetical protein
MMDSLQSGGKIVSAAEKELMKKPYQPPKLVVYGDLAEITRSAGSMHMLDGGTMVGMRRTA